MILSSSINPKKTINDLGSKCTYKMPNLKIKNKSDKYLEILVVIKDCSDKKKTRTYILLKLMNINIFKLLIDLFMQLGREDFSGKYIHLA